MTAGRLFVWGFTLSILCDHVILILEPVSFETFVQLLFCCIFVNISINIFKVFNIDLFCRYIFHFEFHYFILILRRWIFFLVSFEVIENSIRNVFWLYFFVQFSTDFFLRFDHDLIGKQTDKLSVFLCIKLITD